MSTTSFEPATDDIVPASRSRRRTLIRVAAGLAVVAAFGAGIAIGQTGVNGASDSISATGPADSYQLTSSSYNVSPASNSQQIHALCGDGYHVAGNWNNDPIKAPENGVAGANWVPTLTIHGADIVQGSASGYQQNGTDSNGHPTYQGVDVRLHNISLIHSHAGSFTWTCDANS
jgi:hypothetical protein